MSNNVDSLFDFWPHYLSELLVDTPPIAEGDDSYSRRWFANENASLWCGLFVIALGVSALIGWAFDIAFLKTVFVGYASMKPNTALTFVLLGTSLSRRSMAASRATPTQPEPDAIATWSAALAILFAAMTVFEYVASVDLGIDQLLFRQPDTTTYPGRMAAATALALLSLGLSLVAPKTVNGELIDGRALFSFTALSISVVAFIGYLVDAPSLYQLSAYVSMALHTSIGLIVLSCGTLLYLNNRQSVGVSELEIFTPQTSAARSALRPTIFAAFGFLAISAAGSIVLFLTVIKAQGWVTHTFMVHQTADSLLGELRDAETGQRGFIVTGNASYLEPYNKSLTTIPGIESKLRELTADNAADQVRLTAIQLQVAKKLKELSESIEFERSGRHADALDLVTSDGGKGLMDEIRAELAAFLASQDALLDMRQGWLQKMQTAGVTAAVLCLLLTVASGRSVANMLYAYFAGLQDARQKLTEANASLDRRVIQQTAELAETEQQRRFALEVAELGDWTLDLATDQSVRSTRHDLIFGYETPPDLWGFAEFIEHVMPEDREFVTSAFETALAKKDDWRFECRIRRHGDDEIRWIDVQGKHYGSQITGKKGLLGTVADITERKVAELSLATTNRRLALLGRVSNDLIVGASPRELLKSAFDAVAEEVRAEYYFNYLVDATQPGWLELEAAGGLDEEQKREFGHIAFGQHLCGRVAQTREAIVLDNIDLSTDPAASGVRAMGIRSYVGLPLSAHGKLFGTLAMPPISNSSN